MISYYLFTFPLAKFIKNGFKGLLRGMRFYQLKTDLYVGVNCIIHD